MNICGFGVPFKHSSIPRHPTSLLKPSLHDKAKLRQTSLHSHWIRWPLQNNRAALSKRRRKLAYMVTERSRHPQLNRTRMRSRYRTKTNERHFVSVTVINNTSCSFATDQATSFVIFKSRATSIKQDAFSSTAMMPSYCTLFSYKSHPVHVPTRVGMHILPSCDNCLQ